VQVTDNVGVNEVTSQPASGSEFTVDTTTPVTYTATDKAGLKRSCTFNVQVKRQAGESVEHDDRNVEGVLVRFDTDTCLGVLISYAINILHIAVSKYQ